MRVNREVETLEQLLPQAEQAIRRVTGFNLKLKIKDSTPRQSLAHVVHQVAQLNLLDRNAAAAAAHSAEDAACLAALEALARVEAEGEDDFTDAELNALAATLEQAPQQTQHSQRCAFNALASPSLSRPNSARRLPTQLSPPSHEYTGHMSRPTVAAPIYIILVVN
mmetsp:Transcript_43145/g.106543  ORF Transcript_43145/g.106543 Transcript_43145/m.106543 type:complete len:166 (-) Transcript_43145:18-515(-)